MTFQLQKQGLFLLVSEIHGTAKWFIYISDGFNLSVHIVSILVVLLAITKDITNFLRTGLRDPRKMSFILCMKDFIDSTDNPYPKLESKKLPLIWLVCTYLRVADRRFEILWANTCGSTVSKFRSLNSIDSLTEGSRPENKSKTTLLS